ncbi:hypothetical protein D7030_00300 [Flavobacteriaceae bacterium AU392]|nr:hypothetical protein D1817_14135 [Flavobacteriaceae bacterium]RKM86974.1 hypothetical protein D7030_00300 [Flavobacteriaceae bacterium AU392]
MKKLVFIALAFITLQVTAQEHRRGHRDGQRRGVQKARALQQLSPEQIAEVQAKRMTLHLDLTEVQQKEIQELLLQQTKARKEKIEAFKKSRADKNIERPSKEKRLDLLNERLDNQIAMKQKMKNILNEEQYQKWQKSNGLRKRHIAKTRRSKRH